MTPAAALHTVLCICGYCALVYFIGGFIRAGMDAPKRNRRLPTPAPDERSSIHYFEQHIKR